MNRAPIDHLVYGNVADPMHPQARGFRIVHGPSRFNGQALDALAKRFSSCAPTSQDPTAASMVYLPWMHDGKPYGCLVQHLQPLAQDDQGRPAGFFHALLFPRETAGVDPLHNALACAASFHRESLDGNPARFLELVRAPDLAGDPSVRVEDLTRVLKAIGGSDPVAAFVDAVYRVTAKSANASFFVGDIRRMPSLLKLLPAGLAYAAAWSFGVKGLSEPHLILDSNREQQNLFGASEPEVQAWTDWLHQQLSQSDRGWIDELARAHDITNWWDMGRLMNMTAEAQLLPQRQVAAAAAAGSQQRPDPALTPVASTPAASAPARDSARASSAGPAARTVEPFPAQAQDARPRRAPNALGEPSNVRGTRPSASRPISGGPSTGSPSTKSPSRAAQPLVRPSTTGDSTASESTMSNPQAGSSIPAAELDRQVLQVEQRLQQYVEERLEAQGAAHQVANKTGLLRRLFNLWVRLRPEIYFILGVLFALSLFALQTPLKWIGEFISRWTG